MLAESSINQTYQLLSWKKVRKGTNGGVSLYGTLASIVGGFLVGLSFYLILKISFIFSDSHLSTNCN